MSDFDCPGSPHTPSHLGEAGPGLQVHRPVSALPAPAALDPPPLPEDGFNIVRGGALLTLGEHNLRISFIILCFLNIKASLRLTPD